MPVTLDVIYLQKDLDSLLFLKFIIFKLFVLLHRPMRGSAWATARATVSQAMGTYQTWCSKATPHQELQQALIPRTWTLWMR